MQFLPRMVTSISVTAIYLSLVQFLRRPDPTSLLSLVPPGQETVTTGNQNDVSPWEKLSLPDLTSDSEQDLAESAVTVEQPEIISTTATTESCDEETPVLKRRLRSLTHSHATQYPATSHCLGPRSLPPQTRPITAPHLQSSHVDPHPRARKPSLVPVWPFSPPDGPRLEHHSPASEMSSLMLSPQASPTTSSLEPASLQPAKGYSFQVTHLASSGCGPRDSGNSEPQTLAISLDRSSPNPTASLGSMLSEEEAGESQVTPVVSSPLGGDAETGISVTERREEQLEPLARVMNRRTSSFLLWFPITVSGSLARDPCID